MKKFRVTTPTYSQIRIFDSIDAAYSWHTLVHDFSELEDDEKLIEESKTIDLCSSSFLEIEWLGSNWFYDPDFTTRVDIAKIGYGKESQNESGLILKPFFGFVTDLCLPLREYRTDNLWVRKIVEEDAYIDLKALFDKA